MATRAPKQIAKIPTTTPRKGTVPDTNTKQMSAAFWTPRHLRNKR